MPGINQRFNEARQLRQSGKTYKQIGDLLGGVSAVRARQMVRGADRNDEIRAVIGQLSVMAYNALMRIFGKMPSRDEVSVLSDVDLLRQKCLGRKTLKNIREWQAGS